MVSLSKLLENNWYLTTFYKSLWPNNLKTSAIAIWISLLDDCLYRNAIPNACLFVGFVWIAYFSNRKETFFPNNSPIKSENGT